MENSILKIYLSSSDKIGTNLFYELIVQKAKEFGIVGATVYRGIMGYGPSSYHIHTSRFWELTEKLPLVIEFVDKTTTLNQFYDLIDEDFNQLQKGCLITIEPIEIKLFKVGKKT